MRISASRLKTARFFASAPYYVESGVNALMGRQKNWTESWQRCHDRFFDSATNSIYRAFSTDTAHPDYLTARKAASWGSLIVGGYGLAKGIVHGGVRATSWGINKFRRSSPQIFIPSRPATSVVSNHLLKNELIAKEIAGGHAFEKHVMKQNEFPGFSRIEFEQYLKNILNNPTETKSLQRGRTAYWDQESGTLIIRDPLKIDGGTAFRPTPGKIYFDDLDCKK